MALAPHSFGVVVAALGCAAAAPLVGEHDLAAVVAEGGRVPVGEVGVGHGGETEGVGGVGDVEEEAVAAACAARQADVGVDGDVVALGGAGAGALGHLGAFGGAGCGLGVHPEDHFSQRHAVGGGDAVATPRVHDAVQSLPYEPLRDDRQTSVAGLADKSAPVPHGFGCGLPLLHGPDVGWRGTVPGRCHQILEDPRRGHDCGGLGIVQRDPDHFDAEEGGVRVLVGREGGTAGEFLGRPYLGGAGDIDVDVLVVTRVLQHGVGVRAAAGLHVRDVLRTADVGDVEDANPAEPFVTDVFASAPLAVQASAQPLAGDEEEVRVHRDIALGRGAHIGNDRDRVGRVGDVPHLDAVVVALDGVVPGEGQVGVGPAHEGLLRGRRRQHAEVPDGLARVEHAGLEADAGVGGGGVDVQAGGVGEGGLRDGGHGGGRAGFGRGLGGAPVQGSHEAVRERSAARRARVRVGPVEMLIGVMGLS